MAQLQQQVQSGLDTGEKRMNGFIQEENMIIIQ